jgi:hypothetical protein
MRGLTGGAGPERVSSASGLSRSSPCSSCQRPGAGSSEGEPEYARTGRKCTEFLRWKKISSQQTCFTKTEDGWVWDDAPSRAMWLASWQPSSHGFLARFAPGWSSINGLLAIRGFPCGLPEVIRKGRLLQPSEVVTPRAAAMIAASCRREVSNYSNNYLFS